jgi:hypothetical protein
MLLPTIAPFVVESCPRHNERVFHHLGLLKINFIQGNCGSGVEIHRVV